MAGRERQVVRVGVRPERRRFPAPLPCRPCSTSAGSVATDIPQIIRGLRGTVASIGACTGAGASLVNTRRPGLLPLEQAALGPRPPLVPSSSVLASPRPAHDACPCDLQNATLPSSLAAIWCWRSSAPSARPSPPPPAWHFHTHVQCRLASECSAAQPPSDAVGGRASLARAGGHAGCGGGAASRSRGRRVHQAGG